ncbi:uncharacterized protein N7477_003571 [Penicillium maclennaniae]|uniref:uncharacterized protein n=1 Tax=Penicillium maclennaniae TaxID=1343394 RepID=UPI00254123CE|nr:uncharacterized protein N7477_003571 [Penicillium maclennaniae]KAJ5677938.1 hypothetical protein N7477_003571 [Penicillium maclennaniae]
MGLEPISFHIPQTAQDPGSLEMSEARGRILTITKTTHTNLKVKIKETTTGVIKDTMIPASSITAAALIRVPDIPITSQDSNGRFRGGRSRDNNQSLSPQQQPPVPVTSLYCSVDGSDLFDESMEPVAPTLGCDGMYYDADGDLIIEDAPNVDIATIVTQGTIEMAKITQRLLEQIATFS